MNNQSKEKVEKYFPGNKIKYNFFEVYLNQLKIELLYDSSK